MGTSFQSLDQHRIIRKNLSYANEHKFLKNILLETEIPNKQSIENLNWNFILSKLKELNCDYLFLSRMGPLLPWLPGDFQNHLFKSKISSISRDLYLKKELFDIAKLFYDHHIDFLVLKGGAIALHYYQNSAIRQMKDLDILVHPESILKANQLLKAQGYYPNHVYKSEKTYLTTHHHSAPLCHKEKQFVVELHFNSIPFKMKHFEFTGIWDRAISNLFLKELPIKSLSHEDTIMHSAFYLTWSKQYSNSIIDIIDIMQIIKSNLCNFDKLLELVQQCQPRFINALYLISQYTKLHGNTHFPLKIQDLLEKQKQLNPWLEKALLHLFEKDAILHDTSFTLLKSKTKKSMFANIL